MKSSLKQLTKVHSLIRISSIHETRRKEEKKVGELQNRILNRWREEKSSRKIIQVCIPTQFLSFFRAICVSSAFLVGVGFNCEKD